MDKQFSQTRASFAAAQFSSSKSFSSASFSSSNQSTNIQQSQELDGFFTNRLSNFNNMPTEFRELSVESSNQKFSNTMMEQSFKSMKNQFQNDLPSHVDLSDKFTNISLSQKQSAQYSNRSVTSTVTSKVIRKKIVRKIVNGVVVEEEEEVDEIENEPVTQQFVEENSRNDITRTAFIKQGGKLFDITQSKSCPEIKDKPEVRNKTRAIEAPKDRTSKIKSLLGIGMGKKKKCNVGRIQNIIEELIQTEEKYVSYLRIIVDHLMPELQRPDAPEELKEDNTKLFGNVEIIFLFHDVEFLTQLKESEKNAEDIANCFLRNRKHFSLYRHFNRNQPISEIYNAKYGAFFNEKTSQMQFQDIRSFLITPTQRLCRYNLLLGELMKECERNKLSAEETVVKQANEMIKAEIRLGNDLMALDAIKDCHMDLKDQGELIYRDPFTVQRGTEPEFKAMVFLFEKIILFTKIKLENNVDVLYYQDFIYLKDIGLTEYPNDSKKLQVWFKKHTLKPYTLKTPKEDLKTKWVEEIRKQLQAELEQTKLEQQQNRRTLYNLKDIGTEKKNIKIIA